MEFLKINLIFSIAVGAWLSGACTMTTPLGGSSTTLHDSERKRPDLDGEEPEYELTNLGQAQRGDFATEKIWNPGASTTQGLALSAAHSQLLIAVAATATGLEIRVTRDYKTASESRAFFLTLPTRSAYRPRLVLARTGANVRVALDFIELVELPFASDGPIAVASVNDRQAVNTSIDHRMRPMLGTLFASHAKSLMEQQWTLKNATNGGFEYHSDSGCVLELIGSNDTFGGELRTCPAPPVVLNGYPCNLFGSYLDGKWQGSFSCANGNSDAFAISISD